MAGFSLKWLRDVAAQQRPDGCITNIAPDPVCWQQDQGDIWRMLQGSSGWGDAVVIVPWELWRAYGDDGVLSELWPSMVGWLDYAATMARTVVTPAGRPSAPSHCRTRPSSGTGASTGVSGPNPAWRTSQRS